MNSEAVGCHGSVVPALAAKARDHGFKTLPSFSNTWVYACCEDLLPAKFFPGYSAQQQKMLPLFPVEYVRNCSTIHFFNSTGMYRNKIVIFWAGSFS